MTYLSVSCVYVLSISENFKYPIFTYVQKDRCVIARNLYSVCISCLEYIMFLRLCNQRLRDFKLKCSACLLIWYSIENTVIPRGLYQIFGQLHENWKTILFKLEKSCRITGTQRHQESVIGSIRPTSNPLPTTKKDCISKISI